MHTTKYYQNQTLSVAIVSVLATPGVRRGGASVGVGVGVVGGDTVGYGGMGYGGIGRRRMGVWGGWPCDPLCRPPSPFRPGIDIFPYFFQRSYGYYHTISMSTSSPTRVVASTVTTLE